MNWIILIIAGLWWSRPFPMSWSCKIINRHSNGWLDARLYYFLPIF